MNIRNNASRQFGRHALFCLLAASIFAAAPQSAQAAGDLTVEEFAGPVKLKMGNRWQDPRVGMSIQLPATVSTGDEGSIKLAQDGSVFSVAATSAIEMFTSPGSGQLVTRVVQSQGGAFYDISSREHRKLRVETPYLAAVIKGTQFNVTVEPERSSIALYEGLLRIEAMDIGEAVDLRAGFIARRRAGDMTITVIPMDGGETASGKRSGVAADSGDGSSRAANLPGASDGGLDAEFGEAGPDIALGVDSALESSTDSLTFEQTSSADLGTDEIGADLGTDAMIGDLAELDADAGIDADLATGEVTTDLGTDASVGDLADLDASVGVDADLATGEVGADLSTDATVGDIDLGTEAIVNDGSLDAELDLGTLDSSTDLNSGLLDGGDTGTGDTTEEEEVVPLLDTGNLL